MKKETKPPVRYRLIFSAVVIIIWVLFTVGNLVAYNETSYVSADNRVLNEEGQIVRERYEFYVHNYSWGEFLASELLATAVILLGLLFIKYDKNAIKPILRIILVVLSVFIFQGILSYIIPKGSFGRRLIGINKLSWINPSPSCLGFTILFGKPYVVNLNEWCIGILESAGE